MIGNSDPAETASLGAHAQARLAQALPRCVSTLHLWHGKCLPARGTPVAAVRRVACAAVVSVPRSARKC
jgi:hypothetical protein